MWVTLSNKECKTLANGGTINKVVTYKTKAQQRKDKIRKAKDKKVAAKKG